MSRAFFDTNILLYTLSDGDTRQAPAVKALQDGGTISVQVLNEFANAAYRKFKLPWPDTVRVLGALRLLLGPPEPLTVATHETAVRLAARDGIAFYDALIVASALEAGCVTLLTEDLQDGRIIEGRLTIRNPFRA